jgi:hypothetical protein
MTAPSVTELPTAVEVGSCAVCRHALADHDRISLRFCQATEAHAVDGVSSRGCVCPT